jgi:hypothetical protein
VSRNAAEFRFCLCGITHDFWKLPRQIGSHKRTASARESGLIDEKNEGQKSLDTVTKVFKVLICYRKSVIDLIVIFVEEELIFRVSSRVETKMHFSIFAKMRKWDTFREISRKSYENFEKIFAKTEIFA